MKINNEEKARKEAGNQDQLKKGFTTGSCATATTKAAITEILENLNKYGFSKNNSNNNSDENNFCEKNRGELVKEISQNQIEALKIAEIGSDISNIVDENLIRNVEVVTLKSVKIPIKTFCKNYRKYTSTFGVKKYSGDDPDVTNGTLIFSKVSLLNEKDFKNRKEKIENKEVEGEVLLSENVILKRGYGVGLVTKPGLACSIGEPAINPTPRQMILNAVKEVSEKFNFYGFVEVEISIPEGLELALKTFNPNLGIIGGISVLGTTGIVEPMSEQALIDTIKVEMSVRASNNREILVITPGNYGKDFLKSSTEIPEDITVKSSNFFGEAFEFAREFQFKRVILSGHLGKMIKVAGGVLNTHSKYGDRRMEIIAEFTKELNVSSELIEKIHQCVMVDEAVRILEENNLKTAVMERIHSEILSLMEEKIGLPRDKMGVIVFSNKYGLLVESENIKQLLDAGL